MKCGKCIVPYNGYFNEKPFCKIAEQYVKQDDDCHCNTQRVAALMKQLPEVDSVLRDIVELNDGYVNCLFCGSAEGHKSDCPVKLAQEILEAGK
jgi:hypothetical protein